MYVYIYMCALIEYIHYIFLLVFGLQTYKNVFKLFLDWLCCLKKKKKKETIAFWYLLCVSFYILSKLLSFLNWSVLSYHIAKLWQCTVHRSFSISKRDPLHQTQKHLCFSRTYKKLLISLIIMGIRLHLAVQQGYVVSSEIEIAEIITHSLSLQRNQNPKPNFLSGCLRIFGLLKRP